ncbi:QueT transporter family protein [Butyrivibrio sp. CB08]|uniref:QueT transporter family protein n=1 Tax=Butyrivibrio sp. CB08 TaxID=2364879 RepID=UPI000EAA012A|nr:QueT transporter family protein [Butyrivibrio sp. CB08]RKM61894.1 QueT transporter family protein [Butyrivibrio sp. CB08]
MRNKNVVFITHAAAIAALYVVLTLVANAMGLANYAVQVRFSEALTILPYFTPAAIPGLFVGCILSNLLTGCMTLDVIFGSLATLIGAVGTYIIGGKVKKPLAKWLCPIPPIVANMIIVPQLLMRVYQIPGSLLFFTATVGLGEIISCYILGILLLIALEPISSSLFKM